MQSLIVSCFYLDIFRPPPKIQEKLLFWFLVFKLLWKLMFSILLSHKELTGEETLLLAESPLGLQIYACNIFLSLLMTYFSKVWLL